MNVESASVNIVLLGKFRPDNFLPDKLALGKVISRKVAESASLLSLIPGHQVQFKFGWGELLVLQNRFQITTAEAPYIRACDFIIKALGDLAPEAEVNAFGINRDSHYDLHTVAARNRLGTRLAPPEAWGAWGKKLRETMEGKREGTSLQGGVLFLQMRQPFLDDGITGWLDVTVTPSSVIPNATGVCFRSNHHHQLSYAVEGEKVQKEPSASEITSRLLASLSDRFDNSIGDAEAIFEGVINL